MSITISVFQILADSDSLVPRMTPILRNRHEKVQEASINLIGRIADRGAEFVPAREWMRICFELLDLLKAHKKGIRRAAVNSFGYIAKSLGPQDVLSVLLTNLRVQERQSRVCSTVAIAIVAETCGRECHTTSSSPLSLTLFSLFQPSHVFPQSSTSIAQPNSMFAQAV